jgi:hypothetical protein
MAAVIHLRSGLPQSTFEPLSPLRRRKELGRHASYAAFGSRGYEVASPRAYDTQDAPDML